MSRTAVAQREGRGGPQLPFGVEVRLVAGVPTVVGLVEERLGVVVRAAGDDHQMRAGYAASVVDQGRCLLPLGVVQDRFMQRRDDAIKLVLLAEADTRPAGRSRFLVVGFVTALGLGARWGAVLDLGGVVP